MFQDPNLNSDHYLVAANISKRLSLSKSARQRTQGELDDEELPTAPDYRTVFYSSCAPALLEHSSAFENILRAAANKPIEIRKDCKNNWYDDNCRVAVEINCPPWNFAIKHKTRGVGYIPTGYIARRFCRKKRGQNAWVWRACEAGRQGQFSKNLWEDTTTY